MTAFAGIGDRWCGGQSDGYELGFLGLVPRSGKFLNLRNPFFFVVNFFFP